MAGQPHSMNNTALQQSPLVVLGAMFRANASEARACLRESDEKAAATAWRRLVEIWRAMHLFTPKNAQERRVVAFARRFELVFFGGAQRMRMPRMEPNGALVGSLNREVECW